MISVRARSAAELLITARRQRTVVGMLRADRISAGEQAPAAEVMQPGPTTVRAHEDLDATRQRMNEHHVAHLLITTPDGAPLGVVDAPDS